MGTDVKNTLFCRRSAFTDIWGAKPSGDPDCPGTAHQPKRRDPDRIKNVIWKNRFYTVTGKALKSKIQTKENRVKK